MLVLAYLKHFDELILTHKKTNKTLDFIAKYSFGLFFIHWYWFFIYNQLFNLSTVIPITNNLTYTIGIVLIRFIVVASISLFSLFLIKTLLQKINPEINTRKFIGI